MNKKILIMKRPTRIKVCIMMDCIIIALFGISAVVFLIQGQHAEMGYNILLVLAWLLVLMKDCDIATYAKLVDLYKEVTKENDEFLAKLVNYLNEKQKDNDTGTNNQ